MRKYKQVKRKEVVFSLNEWSIIENKAAAISLKTGTYIKQSICKQSGVKRAKK